MVVSILKMPSLIDNGNGIVMPSSSSLSSSCAAVDRSVGVPGVSPRFEALVQSLKQVLGPSSGLTSDDVDVKHLARLMEEYDAADEGWMPYNFGDATRGYTRNLIDEGNGKSNLVCPSSFSSRHNTG